MPLQPSPSPVSMVDETQSAVLFEPKRPLRLVSLSIPELRPGQVLVDMAYSGICQSQFLEVEGLRGPDRFLPHTLGHEGSGTVVRVGEGVRKVKAGDRVVLSWIKGEGAEVPSTVYASSEGRVNAGAITTFMRRTVTCENRVTPVLPTMPLREAALLGCAVPTGVGIIKNTARVERGSSVAVFGMGGIGLSVILGARLAEAKVIIAIDLFDAKLERAKQLGATHGINARRENSLEEIRKLTEGRGVDYAIEAAGKRETMETAFRSVREKGGLCILAGNLPHGEEISIDPFNLIKGRQIRGTWGGETQPDRDIPEYVSLYFAGKLKLERLVTREYPLEEINEAFRDLRKGEVGRALLRLH